MPILLTARIDAFLAWFQSHKAVLGAFFLGLATIIGGSGTLYGSEGLVRAAAVLALIGGALSGGGLMKSDDFYRDKVKLIETKVDRRNPTSLIPVQDLRKLLADEPLGTEVQREAEQARLEAIRRQSR